jgi:hypothetical protein
VKPQPASTREAEPQKRGSIRLCLPLYPFAPSAGAVGAPWTRRSTLDQAEAPAGRGRGGTETQRGGAGGVEVPTPAWQGGAKASAGESSAAGGVRACNTRAVVRELRQMWC